MRHTRLQKANQIARRTFRKYHGSYPEHLSQKELELYENIEATLGIYRKTRALCSSPYCCGNPRRTPHVRVRTRQEVISDLDFDEQLKELGTN